MWALVALVCVVALLAAPVVLAIALSRLRDQRLATQALAERVDDLERAVRALRRSQEAPPPATPPPVTAAPSPPPAPPPRPAMDPGLAALAAARAETPLAMPEPPPPAGLSLEQRIGGRWATWVAIVALLFATGLFLRWSFERGLIGPMARVVMGAIGGVLMLAGGVWLRHREDLRVLSLGLTGGGLGALYVTLYAAHGIYGFIPAPVAFGLMGTVTALGAVLAVAMRQQATALLAILGGLLTPILVSTEHPDERVLLAYLIVLDAMVLLIARHRSWPALNRLAWAGTLLLLLPVFVVETVPEHPLARLVLLTILFALFAAVPLVRAWADRVPVERLDLLFVVGNAAAWYGALYATLEVWRPRLEGPAAIALAALYLLVGVRHRARVREDAMAETAHLGVAAVLFALAFPLMLDGPWVTLSWAAQGVAFAWIARTSPDLVPRAGAALLLLLAVVRAAFLDPYWYPVDVPVWNVSFAVQLAVVAALVAAGLLAQRGEAWSEEADARSAAFFVAALLLALLLWREPPRPWPPVLLGIEMLALAWLGGVTRSFSMHLGAAVLGGVLFVRLFVADRDLAREAAVSLVNGPLLLGIGAAAAMAIAGTLLRAGRSPGSRGPDAGAILQGAAGATLLVALSLGWHDHMGARTDVASRRGRDETVRHLAWMHGVGLSVLWTVYGAALLGWGWIRDAARVRYAALGLLGVVVLKVFLVDLAAVEAIYRVLSFAVLGLVLLGVSFLYQRRRAVPAPEP